MKEEKSIFTNKYINKMEIPEKKQFNIKKISKWKGDDIVSVGERKFKLVKSTIQTGLSF